MTLYIVRMYIYIYIYTYTSSIIKLVIHPHDDSWWLRNDGIKPLTTSKVVMWCVGTVGNAALHDAPFVDRWSGAQPRAYFSHSLGHTNVPGPGCSILGYKEISGKPIRNFLVSKCRKDTFVTLFLTSPYSEINNLTVSLSVNQNMYFGVADSHAQVGTQLHRSLTENRAASLMATVEKGSRTATLPVTLGVSLFKFLIAVFEQTAMLHESGFPFKF